MINSHVSQPCLVPITQTDGEQLWIACSSSPSDELMIIDHVVYISPVLVSSLIIGIASRYLAKLIVCQHRLHQIIAQLQQIIALERMLSLTGYRSYKFQNSMVSEDKKDSSSNPKR